MKINICNPSGNDCGMIAEWLEDNPEMAILMTGLITIVVISGIGISIIYEIIKKVKRGLVKNVKENRNNI